MVVGVGIESEGNIGKGSAQEAEPFPLSVVGREGLEPSKAEPADLQSAPFAARDTDPFPNSS